VNTLRNEPYKRMQSDQNARCAFILTADAGRSGCRKIEKFLS